VDGGIGWGSTLLIFWNMVPLCLMWTVWKERNSRTFENVEIAREDMATIFFLTLFEWSRVWWFTHSVSVSDFIHSLHLSS
jgi:hypothetical protein